MAIGALVALAVAVRTNQGSIEAYFDNHIGAPVATMPRSVVEPGDGTIVRLAAVGDVGTGDPEEYATASVMDTLDQERNFDAILLLGDNVYESGNPAQVQTKVLEPFGPVLDGDTELIAVLGNHDVRNGNGPGQLAALGAPGPWYSEEVGNTLVIALDSNQPDNPDQLAWLRSVLDAPRPAWTIVVLHHPAYSAGSHGSDAGVQDHLVPLFERYGVDLVLSGHDHDYERSQEIDGVTYVVSGAGAKLRPTGREDFTAVSWSTYHFVDLAISADRIEGQAVDHQGRAIDTFTLYRTSSPSSAC